MKLAITLLAFVAASAAGCAATSNQFADPDHAKKAGQSLIVGQLDPTCPVSRIEIHQAGRRTTTIKPDHKSADGWRFSAAVPPGHVVLKAYIGTIELSQTDNLRRQLPVKSYFISRMDVPPDSVTYIGRLYHLAPRQTLAQTGKGKAKGTHYRVHLRASDDWANTGGAHAYLKQYHPHYLDQFSQIRSLIQQSWPSE